MTQSVMRAFGLLGLLVAAQPSFTALDAQIVSPEVEERQVRCGPSLKKKEVLVLDLESFGSDVEAVKSFLARHVKNLDLKSDAPETIRTALRSARKDRLSAMRRAQTTAAERGCNVVLVLRAWEGANDAAFAQSIPSAPGGGSSIAVGMHYAYATVVMGTGDH